MNDNKVDSDAAVDMVSRKTGAQSGCGGCEYDLELIFKEYGPK